MKCLYKSSFLNVNNIYRCLNLRFCRSDNKSNNIIYVDQSVVDSTTNDDVLFKQAGWNLNDWCEDHLNEANKKVLNASRITLTIDQVEEVHRNAEKIWDQYYSRHENRSYRNRYGLAVKFPELFNTLTTTSGSHDPSADMTVSWDAIERLRLGESYAGEHATTRILDVGCGVGNAAIPILRQNCDAAMFLYCCDFSTIAVDILKKSDSYDERRCKAFVCDITQDNWEAPFPPESLDYITIIFVLSACDPQKYAGIISKLSSYLKPGGAILTQERGIYDMVQLRKKEGSCIGVNRYVSSDGIVSRFFTKEDISRIMEGAGLQEVHNNLCKRIVLNRKRNLKMFRVFSLSKYVKPIK